MSDGRRAVTTVPFTVAEFAKLRLVPARDPAHGLACIELARVSVDRGGVAHTFADRFGRVVAAGGLSPAGTAQALAWVYLSTDSRPSIPALIGAWQRLLESHALRWPVVQVAVPAGFALGVRLARALGFVDVNQPVVSAGNATCHTFERRPHHGGH